MTKLKHCFYPIKPFSVITTGGTGGHIFPAIRLGSYIQQCEENVYFYTNELSCKFFEKKGYIETKQYRKIFRYTETTSDISAPMLFSANNKIIPFRKSFSSYKCFVIGMLQAFWFLFTRGGLIKNIIGFGGYASFPVVFFGAVFFKKIYLHEQNTTIGKVNEAMLPLSKKCFYTFEISNISSKKFVHSGMPLTKSLEVQGFVRKSIDDTINVLVLSGSNGSDEANAVILPAIIRFAKGRSVKVYHQASGNVAEDLSQAYTKHKIAHAISPFFENIYEILPSVNVAISRSGALSVVDLLLFGVPTIFMPMRFSSQNHQVLNASFVVEKNLGFMCKYWETNFYSLSALISFAVSSTSVISKRSQIAIKRNARNTIYKAIFSKVD